MPGAHTKVSAWSLWDKRSDSIEGRQGQSEEGLDLDDLTGSVNNGIAQVKTTSTSFLDDVFHWWGKRNFNVHRRDEEPEEDPSWLADHVLPETQFGSVQVHTTSFSLWDWSTWSSRAKRSVNLALPKRSVQARQEQLENIESDLPDPSQATNGYAQEKNMAFDLWDWNTWWK